MGDPVAIEAAIEAAMTCRRDERTPPTLQQAMHYAVFPGGHRIRPRICLAVAEACGMPNPELSMAGAVALELMHCASLVHDDMPCFDDAALRRGKASVHKRFGEPVALLVGDALILLSVQVLLDASDAPAQQVLAVSRLLADNVGLPGGIVAGQGWEFEDGIDLDVYHRAKTGALFAASTMVGAASAGADVDTWKPLGERLGCAYQIADDLLDVYGDSAAMGKPAGRDAFGDRPNSVNEFGATAAADKLKRLIRLAEDSVPACPGRVRLKAVIARESRAVMLQALSQQRAA